jgi:thiol-disulfide isomerase/thioredoxin
MRCTIFVDTIYRYYMNITHIINNLPTVLLICMTILTLFMLMRSINKSSDDENKCNCDVKLDKEITLTPSDVIKNMPIGCSSCELPKTDETLASAPVVQTVSKTSNTQNIKQNRLGLYYAPWCGYSKMFYPVWNKLVEMAQQKNITNVAFFVVNCDEDKQTCATNQIKGFPTLVLHKFDGTDMPYEGERSAEQILNFVLSNIQ